MTFLTASVYFPHMAKTDKTEAKIKEEIERVEREIAERQIQLKTLRGLLPDDGKEAVPPGFKLARAAREVFRRQPGTWFSVDAISSEISEAWNGFTPNRRSLQVTLADWARAGLLKKDESRAGFFMLEPRQH